MRTSLFIIISFFLLSFDSASAQKTTDDEYVSNSEKSEQPSRFKDRLVFGGNLGGSFGTYSYFQINPMVGYKTTNWWVNGIGLNYIYSGSRGYSQNTYGGSVWSRAYLNQSIMLHTEYEYLFMNAKNPQGISYKSQAPVWLVGAGYQSVGNGFGIGILVLFDLIQNPNSPYSNPIFRIGGMIGF